jgi:hypothetical protein
MTAKWNGNGYAPALASDVAALFGKGSKYRVKDGPEWPLELEYAKKLKDPRKRAEAIKQLKTHRPYLMRIYTKRGGRGRGPRGTAPAAGCYVHGPGSVGFAGKGLALLREIQGAADVVAHCVADEEFAVHFSPHAFENVARVVRPFVRKVVTPKNTPRF